MPAKRSIVEILFKGKDEATSSVKRLNRNLDRTNSKLQRATAKANIFNQILKSMAVARTVSFGISSMTLGMRSLAEEYLNLDNTLRTAGAKFGGIKEGSAAFDAMAKAAREVGATTEFTSAQAAEGLKFMAMAGFEAGTAVKSLPVLTDLATATNADFARTADIATDALGAFGMASKDAAEQTSNLQRISDVLTKTVSSSNVTTEHWFQTMKMAGAVATSAGADVETFSTFVGAMGNSGIKASRAGTTLKNAFLRLIKPPKEAAKALAKYNINFQENGKLRDMVDIVADMQEKFKGLTPVQRDAALGAIFGRYAIAGMQTVMSTGADELREYRDRLYKASGATAEMARIMRGSTINQLKTLKSTVFEVGLQIIETFGKRFPNAIQDTIKWIRGIDKEKLVDTVGKIADGVKYAVGFFQDWSSVLWTFTKAWAAVSIARKAGSFLTLGHNVGKASSGFDGLSVASYTATRTVGKFASTALMSIGWVAPLGLAVYALASNWDKVKLAARNAIDEMQRGEGMFSDIGTNVMLALNEAGTRVQQWKRREFDFPLELGKLKDVADEKGVPYFMRAKGTYLGDAMERLAMRRAGVMTEAQIQSSVSDKKAARQAVQLLGDELAGTHFNETVKDRFRSKYDSETGQIDRPSRPMATQMPPDWLPPKQEVNFTLQVSKEPGIQVTPGKNQKVTVFEESFEAPMSMMGEN